MSFSAEQKAALAAPLDRRHVKDRAQAGRKLSYIEGWWAIAEANRIFGFDGWSRETVELRQLGEPREVDGKCRVAYLARVRVTVPVLGQGGGPHVVIVRDGCGYGSGIDRDLGSAHESALKEAETDAMKRALMTFGNPFGLALYDKDQAQVVSGPANAPAVEDESRQAFIAECRDKIRKATDAAALLTWWNSQEEKAKRRAFDLTDADVTDLKAFVIARADALRGAKAA